MKGNWIIAKQTTPAYLKNVTHDSHWVFFYHNGKPLGPFFITLQEDADSMSHWVNGVNQIRFSFWMTVWREREENENNMLAVKVTVGVVACYIIVRMGTLFRCLCSYKEYFQSNVAEPYPSSRIRRVVTTTSNWSVRRQWNSKCRVSSGLMASSPTICVACW